MAREHGKPVHHMRTALRRARGEVRNGADGQPARRTGASRSTAGGPDGPLVVTGSVYLAGEVMVQLHPTLGPAESTLQDF